MRLKLLIIAIIMALSITTTAHAESVYTTMHFIIYDLANAGQTYDQELGNYLEQAYSLYTGLGMKMAPPCNGTQYTVYVLSSLSGNEVGYTGWEYTYNPSTNQIISACIKYINISASLSQDWLMHTAYHELVHVSQVAYWQYTNVVSAYPWYIEADAEGTASYYTNQCPFDQDYFYHNQYEYDPYDYSGSPIINMYYYSAFIYWLIASGVGPATIESNVFTTSTVDVPWLDNYYVQYLLSLVHGQDLCGQVYYPSFQQITMSTNTYSFTVSLQGLSAMYYEIGLPASGSLEISVSGAPVLSNLLLNREFTISNTTLYMALVNPGNSTASVTVTITYTPGVAVQIVNATYDVLNEELSVELYVTYGNTPVTGTIYVNGISTNAVNGYATATLSNVGWGSIALNVTYNNASAVTTLTLSQISASLLISTLYLTTGSYGYVPVAINNPNNAYVITSVQVTSPPSPTNTYQPMIYFENPNMTVTLKPGQNTVNLYFTVNGQVAQGQGVIYIRISPGGSLSLGYSVVPVQVGIVSAVYNYSGNNTVVKVYVSSLGTFTYSLTGLKGTVYINYTTYVVTRLDISIPNFSITFTPTVELMAPNWVLLNTTMYFSTMGACPGYPVYYNIPITVNGTSITTETLNCGVNYTTWFPLNETYEGGVLTLVINNANYEIPMIKPTINVCNDTWLLMNNEVNANITICVTGPYNYVVLNEVVSNSSITVPATMPINSTELTLNVGFENITLTPPKPSIKVIASNVTLYPNPMMITIEVLMPRNAEYRGSVELVVNGTLMNKTGVQIPRNGSVVLTTEVRPYLGPGTYVITTKLGPFTTEVVSYDVEVLRLYITARVLTVVGHSNNVTVVLMDKPVINLPINVTLTGCENETLTMWGNTTITLTYDRECSLNVMARLSTVVNETTLYWDDLNLMLTNVVNHLNATPILLTGTINAGAFFDNGTAVPAPVLVNGTTEFEVQTPGPVTLVLTCEYLGVSNSTVVHAYVVPREYLYAEEVLARLGNPGALNETITQAIASGNWSLVDLFLNYYNKTTASQYDPLMTLSRYLLEQYAGNGNMEELRIAMLITNYELPIYALIIAIVLIIISLATLRHRSRKS
ncbi:hypothetical protein [Vulcanisaeta thermophila]|uniref:hypothetical protein n=1 Tax=Vulcanisaeta thermophila TaxID=867917 RepID=UPI000A58266E|nr:hypothetical protein [Vulcanisaeta thermophila]